MGRDLEIGFFRNRESARIAYGTVGTGPPVIAPPGWFSHVQLQWENARFSAFFRRLAESHTIVFYDRWGAGLSDRDATDFGLEATLRDIEALVEHLGLERFSFFGISQGGTSSLAYAARHPEQVERLVVYGTYAVGRHVAPPDLQEPLIALVRAHWGLGSRTLAQLFIPTPGDETEAVAWLNRYQHEAAQPETAARILEQVYRWDVSEELARVRAPTLVIHRRRDRVIVLRNGMDVAEGVPGARFVVLEGDIHCPWLGASEEVSELLCDFLAPEAPAEAPAPRETAEAEELLGGPGPGPTYMVSRPSVGSRLPPRAVVRVGLVQTDTASLARPREDGLYRVGADAAESLAERTLATVEEAARKGVKVLLFPELSVDLAVPGLQDALVDAARRHGMLVVPGAFHDADTRRNVARVLGPEGVLWEQFKHIPAVITLGGRRVTEPIRTTALRNVVVGDTPFGRIAVVICRDFLDLDLRVALKHAEPPPDVILNPAFTPVTADFSAAHFEARRSLYAFTFFANASFFGGSMIASPERRRRRRVLSPDRIGILAADLDLTALRAERHRQSEASRGRFIQSTREA